MFGISSSEEKKELVLVFYIGSSSVRGALFWVQKSGVPKIILSIREPITSEISLEIDQFLSSTMKPLDIIANKISKAGIGVPKRIFCILSSPWYFSQTRIISLEKETPFKFTSTLADDLIQKEKIILEKENLEKYIQAGNKVRTIELKNFKTTLNGYETAIPLDQKAKEIEMNIFISMSPEQILFKIEETIKKYFHSDNIRFASFALSSFAVVRDMYAKQENFLLIDIGGEVTDISMTKKNIMRESISFSLGRNFIIRGVATALNCTFSEAESFFSLFKDGHAEVSTAKKLEPIIEKSKTEWLQKFQESLANISNDISVPATIYLTVGRDLADFFGKIIAMEQFNQYTLTESKFEIIFLDTETLHGIAEFEKNAVRDPFIIISAVYINRFLTKI